MSNYLDQIGAPDSPINVRPLKTGGRADWEVAEFKESAGLPVPFAETDITTQLRTFFDKLDQEIDKHTGDPIALVNALARMEAVLADVRSVTANLRTKAAEALAQHKVRRLTISGLASVEGTSEATRTDWQSEELLTELLGKRYVDGLVDAGTGEMIEAHELAAWVLSLFRVEWRLTPIRDHGLDPDEYSTLPKDEDGKTMRTPTIRIHDNSLRKQAVV